MLYLTQPILPAVVLNGGQGRPHVAESVTPAIANPDAWLTRLDLQETSQQRIDAALGCTNFGLPTDDRREACAPDLSATEGWYRHSCWAADRRRVWLGVFSTTFSARARNFANCGRCCQAEYSASTNRYRVVASYCHDRLCGPCNRALAAIVEGNICQYLHDHGQVVRFLTITIRHSHLSLSDQITRLYKCFAELRRRDFWKKHCVGGVATLEVKLGKDGRAWHPHLHCLIEGGYVPHKELSEEWLAVTGDSSIIDVRAVDDNEHTVSYICKYVSKPVHHDILLDPVKLPEYAAAIKGRRRLITWGTWRGLKLTECPDDPVTDWVRVASLNQLFASAARGDLAAKQLLNMVIGNRPAAPPPILSDLPPPASVEDFL